MRFEFLRRCLSILDGVVQKRGADQYRLSDASFSTEQMRQGNGVIDIGRGLGVLTLLIAMFPGGELQRSEDQPQGVAVDRPAACHALHCSSLICLCLSFEPGRQICRVPGCRAPWAGGMIISHRGYLEHPWVRL